MYTCTNDLFQRRYCLAGLAKCDRVGQFDQQLFLTDTGLPERFKNMYMYM